MLHQCLEIQWMFKKLETSLKMYNSETQEEYVCLLVSFEICF